MNAATYTEFFTSTVTTTEVDDATTNDISNYACTLAEDKCPTYSFVTQTLFVGFFCIVGLIGNTISFYVFYKTKVKSSTLFLFQSLSIVDNMLLVTVFPVFCLEPFVVYTGYFDDYIHCGYKFLIHVIFFPWASVNQTATVWLTVLVGLNRYIAVCRPYQSAKISSVKQSKIQLAIVLVFSFLYNIPKFFETYVVRREKLISDYSSNKSYTNFTISTNDSIDYNGNDKTCWCLAFSSYYMNDSYLYGYESVMYTIFLLILPLSTLTVLNILLIRQLKKLKKRRAEMQSVRQQQDNNVTLVLIIVVLVFIVCQTPALINRLMWGIYEDNERACPGFQYYFSRMSNMLVIANSSVNFFIYYFFNLRFRQVLSQTTCGLPFRKCLKKSSYVEAAATYTQAPATHHAADEMKDCPPVADHQIAASTSSGTVQSANTTVTRKKPQASVETKFISSFQEGGVNEIFLKNMENVENVELNQQDEKGSPSL